MASHTNNISRPSNALQPIRRLRPQDQRLPTLDEIYTAIPAQTGIRLTEFKALFLGRFPCCQYLRTLLLMARTVAYICPISFVLFRKARPTNEELYAAIGEEGLSVRDFMNIFHWNEISEARRRMITEYLDMAAYPHVETGRIIFRRLTVEEIISAIPREGTSMDALLRRFEPVLKPYGMIRPGETWRLFKNLSYVAEWDVFTEKLYLRDADP